MKYYIILAALLIPLIILTACGGGGLTTTTSAAQTAATPAPTTTQTQTAKPTSTTTTVITTTPTHTSTTAATATSAPTEEPSPTPEPTETPTPTPTTTPEPVVFTLTSPAFGNGQPLLGKYSYNGGNKSPELDWSGAPEGTVSFALIMEDPDAPGGTFTHWVIFNMKSDITGLGEEIPAMPTVGDNIKQGTNDFGEIGYGGPAPPSGTHRYYIRLYALDKMLDLAAGASRSEVISAMQEHILDMAELMGTYSA